MSGRTDVSVSQGWPAALLYGSPHDVDVKRFSLPWLQNVLAIACAGAFC